MLDVDRYVYLMSVRVPYPSAALLSHPHGRHVRCDHHKEWMPHLLTFFFSRTSPLSSSPWGATGASGVIPSPRLIAKASRGSLEMSCCDLPGSSCSDRRYPVKDFLARLQPRKGGEIEGAERRMV